MSGDNTAIIIFLVFMGVLSLIYLSSTIRLIPSKFGPVKTVKAVVTNKYISKSFSKYDGNGEKVKYVIVFSIEGKKKYFFVSQFSHDGYRVNEKGTLTYKGSTLLKFE